MPSYKLKIAEIRVKDTQTKFGPRKQVSIREALDGGDRWVSGLLTPAQWKPEEWNPGMVKDVEVFERISGDRSFWNFKLPGRNPGLDLSAVHAKLDKIISILEGKPWEGGPK